MIVLDASALLAVLLDEPGADQVLPMMPGAELSAVNLGEILTKVAERGGSPEEARRQIGSFGMKISAFGEDDAAAVATLRLATRHLGLSFGDRACLALAQSSGLPVMTADTEWAKLDLGIDIRLIR